MKASVGINQTQRKAIVNSGIKHYSLKRHRWARIQDTPHQG